MGDFDLELLSWDELASTPSPAWLVDGHLPEGIVLVWGQPGAGKTYLVLDLVLSLATGERSWAGRHPVVRQGRVLYLVGEGFEGFAARAVQWSHRHNDGEPIEGFVPSRKPFALGRQTDPVEAVVAKVRELSIDVVVVDTLNAYFEGEENSSDSMGYFNRAVRNIRATGATVIILHHSTATGGKERGHTSLRGMLDASIEVSDAGSKGRKVEVVKLRDGRPPSPWYFDLVPDPDRPVEHADVVARDGSMIACLGHDVDQDLRVRLERATHELAVAGMTPASKRRIRSKAETEKDRTDKALPVLADDATSMVVVVPGGQHPRFDCGCPEPHGLAGA